ncbi:hypothetical protein ACOSQ3_016792 [Xanthoceras sorbifolium]
MMCGDELCFGGAKWVKNHPWSSLGAAPFLFQTVLSSELWWLLFVFIEKILGHVFYRSRPSMAINIRRAQIAIHTGAADLFTAMDSTRAVVAKLASDALWSAGSSSS